jgi:hypothetical protein
MLDSANVSYRNIPSFKIRIEDINDWTD